MSDINNPQSAALKESIDRLLGLTGAIDTPEVDEESPEYQRKLAVDEATAKSAEQTRKMLDERTAVMGQLPANMNKARKMVLAEFKDRATDDVIEAVLEELTGGGYTPEQQLFATQAKEGEVAPVIKYARQVIGEKFVKGGYEKKEPDPLDEGVRGLGGGAGANPALDERVKAFEKQFNVKATRKDREELAKGI